MSGKTPPSNTFLGFTRNSVHAQNHPSFRLRFSDMEIPSASSKATTQFCCSLIEAMVAETVLSAAKSIACFLLALGSDFNAIPGAADNRFPLTDLHRTGVPDEENKEGSETDDDDEDDEDNENYQEDDDDDDDAGDEDFSGEEGEDGDPEDDPEANGQGGSDDDDDDNDEDDDDGDEDDDDEDEEGEEEEEDEDDDVRQPPSKKRK